MLQIHGLAGTASSGRSGTTAHIRGTTCWILMSLSACVIATACTHRIVTTTVQRGSRVSIGFDVRAASGAAVPVEVVVQSPGGVVSSTQTTPWSGPTMSVDDGALVQIDASRAVAERGSGPLRCRVNILGGDFVMEMLVTSPASCQMRGVVTAEDVNLDTYGPRS